MKQFKQKKLKNTDFFCKNILSLPCHPYLTRTYFLKIKKLLIERK